MKATIIGLAPVQYREPDVIVRLSPDVVEKLTRVSYGKGQLTVGFELDFAPGLERMRNLERREHDLRCFGEIVAKFLPQPPEPEQTPTA